MEKFVYKDENRGRIIRSVSLTKEDDALITELNIPLSSVLRAKIAEIREHSRNWEMKILEREANIKKLQDIVIDLNEKIERLESKKEIKDVL